MQIQTLPHSAFRIGDEITISGIERGPKNELLIEGRDAMGRFGKAVAPALFKVTQIHEAEVALDVVKHSSKKSAGNRRYFHGRSRW